MRPLVVMSDIHGNLPALEAVIAALPASCDVVVAGDLVLDGPFPAEVLDLLSDLGWRCIMGNTDRDTAHPNPAAKGGHAQTIAWTRRQLGEERLRMLDSLPFSCHVAGGARGALIVHANPRSMDHHLRPEMTEGQLASFLEGVTAEILAFGHLHIPYIRPVGDLVLVDVSSVGHPKDRDPRAGFTVISWEGQARSITQHRVPYDRERTVAAMRERGMPHVEGRIASLLKASY